MLALGAVSLITDVSSEMVTAAPSSTGTVTTAGLESSTDSDAHVLIAVRVQTATTEAPRQTPRAWRMRMPVQRIGNDIKVSEVEFVP